MTGHGPARPDPIPETVRALRGWWPAAEAPADVRLETADGRVIPCAVRYVGRTEDGQARWTAYPEPPVSTVDMRAVSIRVGMLPANTSLQMKMSVADDG